MIRVLSLEFLTISKLGQLAWLEFAVCQEYIIEIIVAELQRMQANFVELVLFRPLPSRKCEFCRTGSPAREMKWEKFEFPKPKTYDFVFAILSFTSRCLAASRHFPCRNEPAGPKVKTSCMRKRSALVFICFGPDFRRQEFVIQVSEKSNRALREIFRRNPTKAAWIRLHHEFPTPERIILH